MDFTERKLSEAKLEGGAEMRDLVHTTLAAIERADWAEAAQLLHERVFSRTPDALAESYHDNNVCRWRFKPMAELLLLELTQVADASELSVEGRRQRLEWAFAMAGF